MDALRALATDFPALETLDEPALVDLARRRDEGAIRRIF